MASSGRKHWRALKGIFKNLAGTIGVGIYYGQQEGVEGLSNISKEARGLIGGFVDVNFDGDVNTRQSMIGFVFSLFGGPIL